ncbi:MAG: alcohol dehydrogenase catalytic domain-containing protein [Novosphingobium sp.]|nr:alcohol dehydrogenase catalytic domain-containing protein [Novosphingobium sp.]
MKGLMYRGPGEVHFEDIPDAQLPGEKGVIVQNTVCSICGTDLHPYHTDMGFRDYCMGHEAVGTIVECGSEVRNFKKGDRVLVPASIGCGRCKPCLSGNVILCETFDNFKAYGQGDPAIPGCQAEAVPVSDADNNLFHLPDELSDDIGILLTDSAATGWFCARKGNIQPDDTVAVIGLGAVGLQAALAAKAMGAATVFGLDLQADRRADAAALGIVTFEERDTVPLVLDATEGKGVDVVLDAAGGPVTTKMAIALAKRGGRFSQVGVAEEFEFPFPNIEMMFKNLQYYAGVCSVQAEVPHLMDALLSGRMPMEPLNAIVSHRMKLSDGSEAYRLFHERPEGLKKIVMDPTA